MGELRYVTRPRANFTPETVERIAEYDEELARKAQIALDNNLAINFIDLETVEEDLPRLLQEEQQLEAARKAVLEAPVGQYALPKLDLTAVKPQPKTLTAEEKKKIDVGALSPRQSRSARADEYKM